MCEVGLGNARGGSTTTRNGQPPESQPDRPELLRHVRRATGMVEYPVGANGSTKVIMSDIVAPFINSKVEIHGHEQVVIRPLVAQ